MRKYTKFIFEHSPLFIKTLLLRAREMFYMFQALSKENKEYLNLPKNKKSGGKIRNVLIYHISGMYYAGTEKNLQLIANNLVSEYNVYYMYSRKNLSEQQLALMDKRVTLIEFAYTSAEQQFPYFIHGMNPHIKTVIKKRDIDLLIISDSGHSQYPFNTITSVPIILINIFGSPLLQKNVIAILFVSKTAQDHAEKFTGKKSGNTAAFLPVATSSKNPFGVRKFTRERFGIPDSAFVFGRIGRNSDSIFDPIGINAFKKVVQDYPNAYYLIFSPPPILEKMVIEEKIANVYFMNDKESIWDFYFALDALAHFRLDGETFGLNIAEAMYAGNPIISHKSHIWNAHLEYLNSSFSRVAEKDNVEQYASYMREFIDLKQQDQHLWKGMGNHAKSVALDNFSKDKYIDKIIKIIKSIQ